MMIIWSSPIFQSHIYLNKTKLSVKMQVTLIFLFWISAHETAFETAAPEPHQHICAVSSSLNKNIEKKFQ